MPTIEERSSMSNWKDYEAIINQQDAVIWEEFKKKHCFVRQGISDAVFLDLNLEEYDFSFIDFVNCKFVNCNLSKCFMVGATFSGCEFANGTILTGAKFGRGQNAKNARELGRCEFYQCDLSELYAREITIENTSFRECNLKNADLSKNAFSQSIGFRDSDLSGCDFSESSFHKAGWSNCKIGPDTQFYKADFISSYPLTNDGSDSVTFSRWRDNYLDWSKVRFYSSIPVFGIAWASFIASIVVINFISYLNGSELLSTIKQPIAVPSQAGWIIAGTILLGISSTIYKFKCPDTVQNFTETEWVYEHKHPRLFYLVDLLKNEAFRLTSVLLMYAGGLVALYPALVHLISAISYLLRN